MTKHCYRQIAAAYPGNTACPPSSKPIRRASKDQLGPSSEAGESLLDCRGRFCVLPNETPLHPLQQQVAAYDIALEQIQTYFKKNLTKIPPVDIEAFEKDHKYSTKTKGVQKWLNKLSLLAPTPQVKLYTLIALFYSNFAFSTALCFPCDFMHLHEQQAGGSQQPSRRRIRRAKCNIFAVLCQIVTILCQVVTILCRIATIL